MPINIRESYIPVNSKGLLEVLLSRIEVTSFGCWNWMGCTSNGYGLITRDSKRWKTHRLTYALMVEDIPSHLVVDHLCMNRKYINPDHLEPVPQVLNLYRGDTIISAQAVQTQCVRGHEFDIFNTRVRKSGRRACRACERERAARRKDGRYVPC